MRIADVRDGMRRVDVEGTITEVQPSRTVNLKTGGNGEVTEATLKDESGEISLTLWDEEIDKVVKGIVVKVMNGYANTYRGALRLNIGKFGKLVPVGQKEIPRNTKEVVQLPITTSEDYIRTIVIQVLKEEGLKL